MFKPADLIELEKKTFTPKDTKDLYDAFYLLDNWLFKKRLTVFDTKEKLDRTRVMNVNKRIEG
jgi:hypothetical protein